MVRDSTPPEASEARAPPSLQPSPMKHRKTSSQEQHLRKATNSTSSPSSATTAKHPVEKQGKSDFLWSNEIEPHAYRKKALLQKYGKEINKLMTVEWKTKWVCLFVVALHVASGAIAVRQESWLTYLLIAYVVGGFCASSVFLAIHEVTHHTAFKNRYLNDLLALFLNITVPIPYAMHFKEYHMEHHRYLGWDGIDTDLPTAIEAKLFQSFLGKLFFLQFQVVFYATRPMFVRPIGYNRARQICFAFVMTTNLIQSYFFGWRILLYYLLCMVFGAGIGPFAGHFISEHYVMDAKSRKQHPNPEAYETRSYYGWLNPLAWNVGYHNEHHDFPNIPWTRLPELKALAPEFYDPLPKTDSWFLCQLRFLFDPEISQWARMYREEGAGARKGPLVPTADASPKPLPQYGVTEPVGPISPAVWP